MSYKKLGNYITEFSKKNKEGILYPVYSVTNSNGFCTDYFNKDVTGEDKSKYKLVPRGCFAYNPSRINVGSVDWQDHEDMVIVSPLYVVFKCSEELNEDYLKFFLKSSEGKLMINSKVAGSVRNNLKFGELSKFEFNIGSIQEQKDIVHNLKLIEQAIENEKKQLGYLEELCKSRFVEMFSSIKEEQLLEDISEFVTVGIANSATHAYAESGIPLLRNQNIKENHLDDSDLIYIKPEFAAKYESKKLKENDIIAMRTGYPGIACLVPKKYEGCQTFTTLIVRLKPENNPSYVCSYINSDLGKRFIETGKVGAAQQNFGAKSLAKMPIRIAPKELQDEYADFIKQVDKSKAEIQRRIMLYEELLSKKITEYYME